MGLGWGRRRVDNGPLLLVDGWIAIQRDMFHPGPRAELPSTGGSIARAADPSKGAEASPATTEGVPDGAVVLEAACRAGRHVGNVLDGCLGDAVEDALEVVEEEGVGCALEDERQLSFGACQSVSDHCLSDLRFVLTRQKGLTPLWKSDGDEPDAPQ